MADDDKPYMGKRGPRKTVPKGQSRKDRVVTELFGDKVAEEAEERRPKRSLEEQRKPGSVKTPKRRQKIRLGSRWTQALDLIEANGWTMAQFCETLTPEELARGQLKSPDGTFSGPPVKWVPAEFHKACIRELMRQGKVMYQENYLQAIQAMTVIATTPSVDVGSRIRAAQFVIERIEGKVPERLEIGASEPWQELLVGILADVPAGEAPAMRAFTPVPGVEDDT